MNIKKPECPYPVGYTICPKNNNGKCCRECEDYKTCENACLNDPELCGRNEPVTVAGKLKQMTMIDENGIEWVELNRALRIVEKAGKAVRR